MSEKNKQELLKDLQELKQENNTLKSLCNNKSAENEKLSARLQSFEWTLKTKQTAAEDYVPDYGDLSLLNKDGLIKKSIQKDQLQGIVSEYLDLLETSAAIYEKNGDYALGIFSSGWCQMMDAASHRLCNTNNNRLALASGRWLCHESCWKDASLKAMNEGKPAEVACNGGINLFAVPVWANNQIIGAINFGFGSPPKDDAELKKLSKTFQIPIEELQEHSRAYKDRPQFIIDYAKQRIQNSAKYLGYLVERKMADDRLLEIKERYRTTLYSIGDGVITTDKDGRITNMNPVAEGFCGWAFKEVAGKPLSEVFRIINAKTRKAVVDPVKIVLESKKVIGLANHTVLISKNGKEYQIADSAAPIKNRDGEITGVVLVFSDVTEKYKTEEKLRESEERLDMAMMVKNEGLWDWDLTTNETFFDERYYTMAGYKPNEFPQTFNGWAEHVHPEDLQASEDAIKAYMSGASDDFNIEFRFRRKDGSWMWIEGKGKIIDRDKRDKPLRMIGTHTDITHRKQAEQQVKASEAKYRSLIEHMQEGLLVVDNDDTILMVNQAFCKMLDYENQEELLGKTGYEILLSDADKQLIIEKNLQRKKGISEQYEIDMLKRSGESITVLMHASPVKDTSGVVFGSMSTCTDITERKKFEKEIAASEKTMRALVEGTKAMLFSTDLRGRFTFLNQTVEEFFNVPASELIGKFYLRFAHPHDRQWVHQHYQEQIKHKTPSTYIEFRYPGMNNKSGWVSFLVNPLFDRGRFVGLSGVAQDITERKQAEDALSQRDERLQKQNEALLALVSRGTLFQTDLQQAIAEITEACSELAGTERVSVWLYNDDFSEINCTNLYNGTAHQHINNREALRCEEFPTYFACHKKGEVIDAVDVYTDPRTCELPAAYYKKHNIRSMLDTPVWFHNRLGAVLCFEHTGERRVWTSEDVRLATSMAALLSLCFQNEERKQAEEALRESEEKFRSLFNQSKEGIYIHDLEGRILDVNEMACLQSGYSKEEWLGLTLFDGHPGKNTTNPPKAEILEHWWRWEAGQRFVFEGEHQHKDGTIYPVEISTGIVRYGVTNAIMAIVKDITERKLAEEKLKASEETINGIINSSPFSIQLLDPKGYTLRVNPAFVKLFGEAPPPDYTVLNDPNFESLEYYNLMFSLAKGESIHFPEFYYNTRLISPQLPDNPLWMRAEGFPLFDSEGNIKNLVLIHENITERKKSEEALVTSEDRYNRAISGTGAGLWDWDMVKNTVYFSPQWKKMLGYEDHEIPNDFSGWRMLWHPDEVASTEKAVNDYLEGTSKVYEVENRLLCKDGSWHWILTRGDIEKDASGKPIRWTGTNIDITGRKQAEKELIKAKERAEESDRLKSAFLANTSHEIRTPMNGILGFADLLKEPGLTGDEQQEYIEIIEKSGKRMLNIINDIVDISKIEAGLMKPDISESNINEQIEYVYTFFKPEAENKGIKLSFRNTLPKKEAIIQTDREKLYAILTNLVKNALKYTPEGSIELGYVSTASTTTTPDKMVSEPVELRFYVKDTGIGIPKDRQEVIFERFIQADIDDKMARQGAGLGLAISRAYVEMLGGSIWMESEEGKGSAFYFTLPYNAETDAETIDRQPTPPEKNDDVRQLKILVAEDDEISEILIDSYIKMFGKEVLKARTGFEAIEACRDNPDIDLILMDILMPEMGGYEATKQIREFNKKVIIIAQTAYGLKGDRKKSTDSGCNDYIAKPINKNELLALIQKYFGK